MARRVSSEDSELRLSADGRWYHQGELATHPGISRFFHSCIRKDDEGRFYLHNSLDVPESPLSLEEHVYFEVEDTAYFIEGAALDADAKLLRVRLNTGGEQEVAAAALSRDEAGFLYARLPSGDEARFGRQAMLQLEPALEMLEAEPALRLGDQLFVIGLRQP